MAKYVDGFVVPVPTKKLAAYKKLATMASKIFKEHGALEYCECVGDDLNVPWGTPFPKQMKSRKGETVVFSWIAYKSKAQRNAVNKKVMNDKRMMDACDPKNTPFDMKRMLCGGFKSIVDA